MLKKNHCPFAGNRFAFSNDGCSNTPLTQTRCLIAAGFV